MTVLPQDTASRTSRAARMTLWWFIPMLILGMSACVFGPETEGIVDLDRPPYIDPQGVVPSTTTEPSVTFNLNESDRTRQFQVLTVYDWDMNDTLTYAFVLRVGTGDQISIPPATAPRPQMAISSDQNEPYATRYESSQLSFDPCTYRDVLDGSARYGTIQIVIYDTNDTTPFPEDADDQRSVYWTWLLEFHGQCPMCTDDEQCFEDEQCVEGLCVPQ